MSHRIRPAHRGDVPRITEIYNSYIVDSHVSFDLEPWTVGQRMKWFASFDTDTRLQAHVAVDGDDVVVGATWSSWYRPKPGYQRSVETTIVLDQTVSGNGLGTALYSALLDALADTDVHRAYAVIALPNEASVALHHKLGFADVGVQDECGFKLGRYWSTLTLERRF